MKSAPCKSGHELIAAQAERQLTPDELSVLGEHLAGCEPCRLESDAVQLLRYQEAEGSHFAADEFSERRQIAQILERHEQGASTQWRTPVLRPSTSWALAASLVAGIGGWLFWGEFVDDRADGSHAAIQTAVLLTSGTEASEQPGRGLDGPNIETNSNTLALGFAHRTTVWLHTDSHLRVLRDDEQQTRLQLNRGLLQARVDPNLPGPSLIIETKYGSIQVTGTVLAVEATAARDEVRVLRGSVRVQRQSEDIVKVGGGQALDLSEQKPRGLTEHEGQRLEVARQAMTALAVNPAAGATLRVTSQPSGAMVLLDEQPMGLTPLFVRLGAEDVSMTVRLQGHDEVQERLSLARGGDTVRDLRLRLSEPVPPEQIVESPKPGKMRGKAMRARPESPDAEALLTLANRQRAERKWRQAAATYRRLISEYPWTAAAHAAHVSLGDLLLDHLHKPERALALCNAYLKTHPRGIVAQEVMYCRIRAFSALVGHEVQWRQAIEALLEAHPDSMYAEPLRRSLQQGEP